MNGRVNDNLIEAAKFNFVMRCLDALQRGYDRMALDGQYNVNWREDKLTAHLVEKVKLTGFLRSYQISVNHQPPIYSDEVIHGEDDPSEAPRVDFKFSTWHRKNELDYYAEAKNLSENDWIKTEGSHVNASKYRARYIDTGIENFLSGRYPEGCLLGYVVQGETAKVITGVNKLIQTRKLIPRIGEIKKDTSVPFLNCYFTSHTLDGRNFMIRHVFMQFSKVK